MTQVSMSDFRENLPTYSDMVLAGEEFEVLRNRIPVLRVTAIESNVKKKTTRNVKMKAFGMWKDRWSKSKSSVDIVDEWRKGILYGKPNN